MFDLGEMKPFADFLEKKENSTRYYTSMRIPGRVHVPVPPLYKGVSSSNSSQPRLFSLSLLSAYGAEFQVSTLRKQ